MKPLCWQIVPSLLLVLLGVQPAFSLPTIISSTTSVANNLTLDGEGSASTHIVKVANLQLSTDGTKGFTLTISSQSLTKSSGETPISFQVTTVPAGDPAPTSASDFSIPSGSLYTVSTNSAGSSSKDMYIRYTPAALQDPGAYNSSISLVITDN